MKIVILRALYLGDMLCSIPAMRALREGYPHASITLIGLPWAREWIRRYPRYFDEFVEFPGYPGLPERPFDASGFLSFLHQVQEMKADLALQMHGTGLITNPLIGLLGAKEVAGMVKPGHYQPHPETFVPVEDDEHEILRLLRVVKNLGIANVSPELEFPLFEIDRKGFQQRSWFPQIQTNPYVCIHPGARSRHKCWPPKQFAAVADALAAEGFRIVLTGARDERDIIQAVQASMSHEALDTASDHIPLGELALLLQHSRLLICNDTGVSHLAAALRVPSVVLFSATSPQRWAPLDSKRHVAVDRTEDMSPARITTQALGLLDGCGHLPNLTDW
ncbi:glycosyltransferase family 9 protein [Oligoflexus tunisiensis]|uniref:glycosyltransferase family 9 protein n=1 Tax=Oligoflexus tunisiensis TaxID=708132 RepID=UPI000A5CDA43|nr:glycosyltransferase family 9 protein [Oligoflexus tunisiensis]